MQKIMLHGYSGNMGRVLEDIIKRDGNFEIVAGVGLSSDVKVDYDTYTDINLCEKHIDLIIDFSNAEAVPMLLDYSNMRRIPLVLCTTGISEDSLKKVKKYSKNTPILMSANMSVGINTINAVLKQISNALYSSNFDIEIIEKHHKGKVDAPSGTALYLANTIKTAVEDDTHYIFDRTNEKQKRDKTEIGIQAIRGGTIPGEHSIIFAGEDEIIEIKHTALSRKIFAEGAIKAAKFLLTKEEGLYNMEDVIKSL